MAALNTTPTDPTTATTLTTDDLKEAAPTTPVASASSSHKKRPYQDDEDDDDDDDKTSTFDDDEEGTEPSKRHKRAPVAQHSVECTLCHKIYAGPANEELLEACELCRQEVCEGCAAHRWLSCDACDQALIYLMDELSSLNAARKQLHLPPRLWELVLVETAAALTKERAELLKR